MKKLLLLIGLIQSINVWAYNDRDYVMGFRCSEINKTDSSSEHWLLINNKTYEQAERGKSWALVRHLVIRKNKTRDDSHFDIKSTLEDHQGSKYYEWDGRVGGINYRWQLNRENLELTGYYRDFSNEFFHPEPSKCVLSTVEQIHSEIYSITVRKYKEDRERESKEKAAQMKKNKI